MKKILKGLVALMICGALNFGLTNDAQAAEENSSIDLNGSESQEISRRHHPDYYPPPPPREDRWGHRPPPPPHGDYWDNPPPPPPRHGHRPPPPPPHRW